jgi:hypothetical protein
MPLSPTAQPAASTTPTARPRAWQPKPFERTSLSRSQTVHVLPASDEQKAPRPRRLSQTADVSAAGYGSFVDSLDDYCPLTLMPINELESGTLCLADQHIYDRQRFKDLLLAQGSGCKSPLLPAQSLARDAQLLGLLPAMRPKQELSSALFQALTHMVRRSPQPDLVARMQARREVFYPCMVATACIFVDSRMRPWAKSFGPFAEISLMFICMATLVGSSSSALTRVIHLAPRSLPRSASSEPLAPAIQETSLSIALYVISVLMALTTTCVTNDYLRKNF